MLHLLNKTSMLREMFRILNWLDEEEHSSWLFVTEFPSSQHKGAMSLLVEAGLVLSRFDPDKNRSGDVVYKLSDTGVKFKETINDNSR